MQLNSSKEKLTNLLMPSRKDGVMIILSSPSGAGKTTLVKKLSKINKLFLHSYSIKFEDINGNQRFFDCDLPDYFKDRIKLLDFKNNFTTKELKLKNDLWN